MLGKKIIIPFFIMSLIFLNLFILREDTAESTSDPTANTADVVQLQQQLNGKGFWIGPLNGILGSQAYQEAMKFEMDANLIADGFVGLRARQASSLAANDSTSALTLLSQSPAEVSVSDSTASLNQAPSAPKDATVKAAEKSPATVSRGSSSPTRSGKVITLVSTGYDGCYECNKPYYGKPSYIGIPLQRGVVAVDPRVIPMGTRLYVEGYGDAIAADQGNAIKGNRIDLFFDSHQEALKWGMKTVKVTILGK